MTLDLHTLAALVALSGGVAVVTEIVKRLVRRIRPSIADHDDEWIAIRTVAVSLGALLTILTWRDCTPVIVCVGLMVGAASEVVYRYVIQAIPRILDRVTR